MAKKVLIIGSVTYIILGVLALLFYKERMAFLDASFILFYILKDGEFAIQANRFGAILTQAFPLYSSKLGFSLSTIMKVYSLGFIAYFFGIKIILIEFFWLTERLQAVILPYLMVMHLPHSMVSGISAH